jgi:hypothetical protein
MLDAITEKENAHMGAKKKAAAPFKGNAHALLMAIYKDHTLPLALRLEAAKAAIPFEKSALAATSPASSDLDAALSEEAPARSSEQNPRRDN